MQAQQKRPAGVRAGMVSPRGWGHLQRVLAPATCKQAALKQAAPSSHHGVVVVDAHVHVISTAHHPLQDSQRGSQPG